MLNGLIEWRGWTLKQHNGTGLWTASKGAEKLPAKSTTASLRALIDAIEGPQVKECCTGGVCHV